MTTKPQILMCAPDYYGVEYEINPWMDCQREVNHGLALYQWTELHRILVELGVQISRLPPQEGLRDLVFTANAGLIFGNQVYLAKFRHSQRQGESPWTRAWFATCGWEVVQLPMVSFFEGAGDALFCGDTLFAGYRIRSDIRAHQWIGGQIHRRVIPLELVDPHFYHLDTGFCPLDARTALYYPPAFDSYGRQVLAELIEDLVEVDVHEARSFACNAVVVGRSVVTNAGCPKLHHELKQRGYQPIATPLSEFIKAGGSAKCLTLRLDGEEAAGWRTEESKSK